MLPDPSLKYWLVSAYLSNLNNISVVTWKLVILHLSTNSLFQCLVSNAVFYTCQPSTLSTELHCEVSFLYFYQWNLFSLIFLHMMHVHVHFCVHATENMCMSEDNLRCLFVLVFCLILGSVSCLWLCRLLGLEDPVHSTISISHLAVGMVR